MPGKRVWSVTVMAHEDYRGMQQTVRIRVGDSAEDECKSFDGHFTPGLAQACWDDDNGVVRPFLGGWIGWVWERRSTTST